MAKFLQIATFADRPETAVVSGNLGQYNNKSPGNRWIMGPTGIEPVTSWVRCGRSARQASTKSCRFAGHLCMTPQLRTPLDSRRFSAIIGDSGTSGDECLNRVGAEGAGPCVDSIRTASASRDMQARTLGKLAPLASRPERQHRTLFAARSQCHVSISLATAQRRIARSHLGG